MARRSIKDIVAQDYSKVYEKSDKETNKSTFIWTPQHGTANFKPTGKPIISPRWRALHDAAIAPAFSWSRPSSKQRLATITELIKDPETNVNARNTRGETPLHLACRTNFTEAVEKLIKVPGIDVNARDNTGKTPVMVAAEHLKEEALYLMLMDRRVKFGDDSEWLECMVIFSMHGYMMHGDYTVEGWKRGWRRKIEEKRKGEERTKYLKYIKRTSDFCGGNIEFAGKKLNEIALKLKELLNGIPKLGTETMKDASDSDKRHLEAAKKTLECPICLEIMKPPTRIWMCPSTHLICEECRDQLNGNCCPSCRVERVTLRAFIAEQFAKTLF